MAINKGLQPRNIALNLFVVEIVWLGWLFPVANRNEVAQLDAQ
jgi:hypothetical protein